MAQQGGTYRVPARTNVASRSQARGHDQDKVDSHESTTEKSGDTSSDAAAGTEATTVASLSDPSSWPLGHDEGRHDSQQWEVVTSPETDKSTPGHGMSSHFEIKLGWGKWDFSLFSWDINIKRCNGRDMEG